MLVKFLQKKYLLWGLSFALLLLFGLETQTSQAYSIATTVFINEIHYDNTGTDSGEFIEVMGPAGTDLTGWSIVLYNGSGGAVYDTDALSGTIPNQCSGYGTVVINYPSNGIQNGAPDGIALVDNGTLIQFLSYEGSFAGVGGVANGITSTDIGVSQVGTELAGTSSLYLTGTGTTYNDFTWAASTSNRTDGACNVGQTIASVGDTPPQVSSTTPANSATGIADNTNITVNFNETVNSTGTWYSVFCNAVDTTSDWTFQSLSSQSTVTLAYSGAGLAASASCTVTLIASAIADEDATVDLLDGDGNGAGGGDYSFSFTIAAAAVPVNIVINEIHADPDPTGGDANGDSTINSSQDEFVEIVNNNGASLDISGWTLSDAIGVRHTFPVGSIIPNQCAILVFAGGTPTGLFGGAVVQTASGGQLGLNNGGDTVTLNDGALDQAIYTYGGEGGNNTSLTRNPDISGANPLVAHSGVVAAAGALYSAGTQLDGTNFSGCTVPDTAPQVSSTTPANAATNIADNTDITIDFNESVTTVGTWYSVICTTSGDVTVDYSNTPATNISHTLTYTGAGLTASESCTVTLLAANITDSTANNLDGDGDGTGGDNYAFSFDIAAPLVIIFIHDIQGTGAASPLVGNIVSVQAVVTSVTPNLNGFFIQEEDADVDADPLSSEGVFVFTGAAPTVSVGDIVTVTATVTEFNNLTELTTPTISVDSSANPLPTATVLGLPISDYGDYERYEGMLLQFTGALFVNDVYNVGRYGSYELSDSRIYNYTQINAPSVAGYGAYQGTIEDRTILVDDGNNSQNPDPAITINGSEMSATNTLRAGYTLPSITGVLNFTFNEYVLYPTQTVTFTTSNARIGTAPAVGGTVRVASFNVLNYFNGDGAGGGFPTSRGADTLVEFNRQRDKTIEAILGLDADVVGILEMENDNYGANSAIQDLVNGLNGAGGASCGANWTFVDPAVTQLGSDEIKVAIIYCSATVEIATGTTPAYLDAPASVFVGVNTNRVPLAASFEELASGEVFTVVVNHLKSKGGSGTGVNADAGDGQGNWNQQRVDAINAITTWLATDPTGAADTDFILLGDFNAYGMEDPITTIEGLGYTNLVDTFSGAPSYSYGFPNNTSVNPQIQTWGTLDYAFASATLLPQVVGAADWHINADEPLIMDYNTEFMSANHVNTMYNVDAFRSSDHDPLVIGLNLTQPLIAVEVRIAGSINGVINSGNVRAINVLFNKAVRDAGIADPDSVLNPANFVLIASGANGVIDTSPVPATFCALGAPQAGDDIKITLGGITYDPVTYGANIRIQGGAAPLAQGDYLFVICGSTSIVADPSLVALDGNGNGIGGDDFSTLFTVNVPPTVGGGTGGTGTVVDGGIDFDGDGIADVSQLPNTGENPFWSNWIVWVGGLLLLSSFGLLMLGSRAKREN